MRTQALDQVGAGVSDDGLFCRSVGAAPVTSMIVVKNCRLWVACGSNVHAINCTYVTCKTTSGRSNLVKGKIANYAN